MPLVAGIDSSTQSCKVVVCSSESGAIVAEGRAPHPDGTEVDPQAWWDALVKATAGVLEDVDAVSVAGQQHGLVALDDHGEVVRPALLWNDTRSAQAARDLVDELGGAQAWADAVGVVPLASITVSKLRWLAEHEPENAATAAQVMLPHDWLTWRLLNRPADPATDRGDASGTGYWSAAKGEYRDDLLKKAFGRNIDVPRVVNPAEPLGELSSGAMVGPGTGDNMAAALGLGLQPGDVVVSLGTSGTVFAVTSEPTHDGSGIVAGFADATGRHLPLVCTLNAARVFTATAQMLGTDMEGLDALALKAEPGAGGLVLLPYLDGERTPNLPDATGSLMGMTRAAMTPENVARAAVEGVLCGLADGVEALRSHEVPVNRVRLIGGAAQSSAVRAVAADVFGVPVDVPISAEYVALGAARQAAWTVHGSAEPPQWDVEVEATIEPTDTPAADIRARYAEMRHFAHGV